MDVKFYKQLPLTMKKEVQKDMLQLGRRLLDVDGGLEDPWMDEVLSFQEIWVQGRGRGCHFLKQGTWVRRRYCIFIYICVCVRVCVKIYKNKTFHTHIIHAYLIFLNSMIHMNIRIENLKHKIINLINHMT